MANYKGHLFVGSLFFLVSFYLLSWCFRPSLLLAVQWYLLALAGSLFPDIDVKSKGQNYFYWFIFWLLIFLAFMQQWRLIALVSIISIIPLLVHHRGICHRVWFVVGVPMTIALILSCYVPLCTNHLFYNAGFFVIGALSHIWLDLGLRKMLRW